MSRTPTSLTRWFSRREEPLTAWMLLTPAILSIAIFTIYPVLMSIWLSFSSWDLLTPRVFVGLQNYVKLFTLDTHFRQAVGNTVYFVLGQVPLTVAASMLLAVLLNKGIRGIAWLRAAYYMPIVTSTVSVAVVWLWLYHGDLGLINWALRQCGIHNPPNWLSDPLWAKPALIIMSVWHSAGYYMVMFLAGLQNIPDDLYEATEVDGAGPWRRFWSITFPLLSPTTFLVCILLVMDVFNLFNQVYMMTSGGPSGTTETIVFYIYNHAFVWLHMGYACAIAWILLLIVFSLTLLQFKFQKRWVHYE